MADVKISALPAATTPLAGTEVLPIVQSSTTKKVAISDVTAGRAISASSLTLTTTPLAVGSGGTGLASLTTGYIPYGNGTSAFSSVSTFVFNGTNLGIGTASPAYKLDVRATGDNAVYFATTGTANSISAYLASGNGTTSGKYAYFRFLNNDTNAQEYRLGTYGDNNFTIYDAKALSARLTIDTSGNLLVGTTISDGLLTVNGIAKGGIAHRAGTYTAGSTTPSVAGVTFMYIFNSSPTTITNFTGAVEGQIIYLNFADVNTTIDRSNSYLAGGVNFTSTANDMLALIRYGGFWYEVCRSVNA